MGVKRGALPIFWVVGAQHAAPLQACFKPRQGLSTSTCTRHPNWDHIFRRSWPATNSRRFARDTIFTVVPHSRRFGAGYKSNDRPPPDSLITMVLQQGLRARNNPPDGAD